MGVLTYIKIGGAVTLLVLAYLAGDRSGAHRVLARDLAKAQRIERAVARVQGRLNQQQDQLAAAEGRRRDVVREIYRAVPQIIDRPVYRAVAIDDDGVRLLDRAATAANNGGSLPAAPASNAPDNPAWL